MGSVPVWQFRLEDCHLAANPNPDATELNKWFAEQRDAYNSVPDEHAFIKREWREYLQRFFKVDAATCQRMLSTGRREQPADQPEPTNPLTLSEQIEVELLRRLYDSEEGRVWWQEKAGRTQLLGLWVEESRKYLAWVLIHVDDEITIDEAIEAAYGAQADAVKQLLIALLFQPSLPESTEALIAQHYNLGLAARRTELAKEYAQTKDSSLLRQISDLKQINPEHWQ